jgi:hypothetical protein
MKRTVIWSEREEQLQDEVEGAAQAKHVVWLAK